MGVDGLLSQLSRNNFTKATDLKSVRQMFEDVDQPTAVIDGHSWLHKSIYGCARLVATGGENGGAWDKLNQRTPAPFARYVIHRLKLLRYYGINPIIVFDGASLDAKSDTHSDRRVRKQENLSKGNALLAEAKIMYASGRKNEAKLKYDEADRAFQLGVSVSRYLVLHTIKMLEQEKESFQFIIAPFEADAQLAYECSQGRAHMIISEDSDNLTYAAAAGCWNPCPHY
jgi:exonuclease-1